MCFLAASAGPANTSVDAIASLAEAMNKFGILTVIIAAMIVGIGALVFFIMNMNKKNRDNLNLLLKEQNENTIAQNNLLLEKITELTDQQYRDNNAEKNLINIFMKLNNTLKDECHNVQDRLDCTRVGIYACHNGSKTNTGLPFFKTSCVSEWISKKHLISGGVGAHTDLQLGIFYDLVKEVFEHGYYVIRNVEDPEFDNVNAKKFITSLSVKSSIIVAITNSEDLHIGSVTIEFSHVLTDEEEIKEAIEEGKVLADKIVPLLDYSLYDENSIE